MLPSGMSKKTTYLHYGSIKTDKTKSPIFRLLERSRKIGSCTWFFYSVNGSV